MNLHPKTGRPIQPHATFQVGDAATISILGDSYPAVITHVSAKTVYAAQVDGIRADLGAVEIGHDSVPMILDPEEVAEAIAAGKDGAQKFTLQIHKAPTNGSFNDRERYTEDDGTFHRASWATPNGGTYRLSQGARVKRDPHV